MNRLISLHTFHQIIEFSSYVHVRTVGSSDLQKIKKTLDNLYTEKQKLDKEKNKKGGKGKTKASIRIESDNVCICYLFSGFGTFPILLIK